MFTLLRMKFILLEWNEINHLEENLGYVSLVSAWSKMVL